MIVDNCTVRNNFRSGIGKNHLVPMWCRNFPPRAFSDIRTEIISNRVEENCGTVDLSVFKQRNEITQILKFKYLYKIHNKSYEPLWIFFKGVPYYAITSHWSKS
jgi:hypothetical protein